MYVCSFMYFFPVSIPSWVYRMIQCWEPSPSSFTICQTAFTSSYMQDYNIWSHYPLYECNLWILLSLHVNYILCYIYDLKINTYNTYNLNILALKRKSLILEWSFMIHFAMFYEITLNNSLWIPLMIFQCNSDQQSPFDASYNVTCHCMEVVKQSRIYYEYGYIST